MPQVRRITRDDPLYQQECDLREDVLLRPLGLSMERFHEAFPGVEDRFEHFVAVTHDPAHGLRVVGCATLLPGVPGPRSGKLMQMAVNLQRQGEGIGRQLVAAVEARAFGALGLEALFCHARLPVIGFYESLGWGVDSEEFLEVGIPHRRMTVRRPEMEPEPLF